MQLQGTSIIGAEPVVSAGKTFTAFDPRAGEALPPTFQEATEDQVNKALELAKQAAGVLRTLSSERVVALLLAIRSEIEALGDDLVERAAQETALDRERLKGERARTLNQIKLFADVVQEGSWVDARIDPAMLERQPLPRPDPRR